MLYGELLSIVVAMTWTVTALCAEVASRSMGQLQMNVLRMVASLVILAAILWAATGSPLPQGMSATAVAWLLASGAVGYVFGDWCLFTAYVLVGSRMGQLFMTLAPLFSALAAWALLGETLGLQAVMGIVVTLTGIGIVVKKNRPAQDASPVRHSSSSIRHSSSSILHSSFFIPHSSSFILHPSFFIPPPALLFGLGAAMGQGVGIVLSKVGMSLCEATPLLPIAATMVRAVSGLAGFGLAYFWKGDRARMHEGLHDRTTMVAAAGAIVTGPVIGVSLSLLAVQLAPAGIASTLMALTPVFILLPSRWFFGQRITAREVVGSVIACGGVALFFL